MVSRIIGLHLLSKIVRNPVACIKVIGGVRQEVTNLMLGVPAMLVTLFGHQT